MSTRLKWILASIFSLLIIYYLVKSPSKRTVHIIRDLPVMHLQDSLSDDVINYDSDCKVIVYLQEKSTLPMYFSLKNWDDFYSEYDHVPFLFYFHGKDTARLKMAMDLFNFHYPIIWDEYGRFPAENPEFCKNVDFISGVYFSNGEIKLSNPTTRNLQTYLKKCSNGY